MNLPADLVDHICSRREAITKAWLRTLLTSPEFNTPGKIPAPQLVDHLPKLFDELADCLRGEGAPRPEHDARVHGRYRWEQNFSLDEVLRELLLIRGMINAEIESYLREHQPSATAVLMEARRRVIHFFDDALLYSASQFSEQQQAQIEEDKRLMTSEHQVSRSKLQALGTARLRLLRTVAHELRNMLYTAVMIVENLSTEKDPAWRADLQGMLRHSHQQMTTLVNQLLEMAPLLAGRESLRLTSLQLETFATEQCRLFEPEAVSKGLAFHCNRSEALSEIVTDKGKLQRIVTNLVQNAFKYTPSNGSVELRFDPLDAERWMLSVSDTGPGIAKKHRAKIFEEFYRVPGTEEQDGTGLGLSIVRELVGILRGEITVKSEVGSGSTFCVTLPRDPSKLI